MKLVIKVPYVGHYESWISQEIDHAEENECEYFANERQAEEGIPEPLRLDETEIADAFFDSTDYSAAYWEMSRAYADCLNRELSELFGFELGMTWESVDSPKFYNFETDRLYMTIPRASMARLHKLAKPVLMAKVKERHSSRDGFISFYSTDSDDWQKSVSEMDHNELETVLIAAIEAAGGDLDEIENAIMDAVLDTGETSYHAFSNAVDWQKFETRCADKREEKREELDDREAEEVESFVPRCAYTLDMFRESPQ